MVGCAGSGGTKAGDGDTAVDDLPHDAVVLDQVRVVDAGGARDDQAVVLVGELIWDVRPAGGPWPADAEVHALPGRTVTPGLIDAHVHLYLSGALTSGIPGLADNLRANLAWGVLGVADLGAPESIFDLRDRIDDGELPGPRIFATGPFLTAPGSHPCETFNDPQQCRFVGEDGTAAELVGALSRADGIKVALADADFTPWPTPRLDLADLLSITTAAPQPVFAHTDTPTDMADALSSGVDVLAHPVFSESGAPAPDAPVTSTLGAFRGTDDLLSGALLGDDLTFTNDDVVADWQAIFDNPRLLSGGWREHAPQWSDAAAANLEAWHQAGTPIIAGSDAGYWFVPHGLGLIRELEGLVELGLSPAEALAAATSAPAELLGWTDSGFVAPGYRADLLVLSADPTVSISALRETEQIWLRGVPLVPGELVPTSPGTSACVAADDCPDGQRCDVDRWTCADVCDVPGAVVDDCGADACVETSAGEAVCRSFASCSLLHQDCAPSWYGENCVPVDIDTNACWPGGPGLAGDSCGWTGAADACAPGLFCSWVDSRCYTHCDTAAPVCPDGLSCVDQVVEGQSWFGLCL